MGEKAHTGSVVHILYKGGELGGEVLDDHSTGDPLVVMLGDMKLPRGIEEALMGMEAGEEKQVQIPPELGYGSYQDGLAQWYPKQMLDQGYTLKMGDVMFRPNEDGTRQPAFVTDLTQDAVRLDFNHPFAGKTLDYWIKLVALD